MSITVAGRLRGCGAPLDSIPVPLTDEPLADEPLTDDDKRELKTAAYGAVLMVAKADPGFFSMIKESFAASGAMAGSTGLVRDALTSGPQPRLPRRSAAEVEAVVLPALRRSVAILAAKSPADLGQYRETVLTAVRRVAAAAHGVHEAEAAAIEKIERALVIERALPEAPVESDE